MSNILVAQEIGFQVPHPRYTAREYQVEMWDQMQIKKRGVMVWHRRSGKDTSALNFLVTEMFRRVGTYFHFFPVGSQARKAMWNGIDRDGFRYMDYFPEQMVESRSTQEMRITMRNGSHYQLVGTDRAIDWLVGTNPVGCIFSEYALMNPQAWNLIRPILRENGGWALFVYTPRGENHGYKLYKMAKKNPEWFCSLLTVDMTTRQDGTPVISQDDIESERKEGVDEPTIQQEYYCSFEGVVPGAYFGHEMVWLNKHGKITKVPHEPGYPVDTWWDLGIDDSMSVWFSQTIGREIRLINYVEHTGKGLPFMAAELDRIAKDEDYVYGEHHAPHDIKVREIGTGQSREETAMDLGLDFLAGTRVKRKEDAIEAARKILRMCVFDEEKCEQGIACLRNYRAEVDEDKGVRRKVPVHDWASHGADAFMELAMNYEPPGTDSNAPDFADADFDPYET